MSEAAAQNEPDVIPAPSKVKAYLDLMFDLYASAEGDGPALSWLSGKRMKIVEARLRMPRGNRK